MITDGNGTIINNPTKRESSDDVTTVQPETTTAEAKKERKRREAEVKNENGDDKGSVEPVSSIKILFGLGKTCRRTDCAFDNEMSDATDVDGFQRIHGRPIFVTNY